MYNTYETQSEKYNFAISFTFGENARTESIHQEKIWFRAKAFHVMNRMLQRFNSPRGGTLTLLRYEYFSFKRDEKQSRAE